jgi:hypothetical protein
VHDDPVAAPARREPDISVGAQRARDRARVGGERIASLQARLARLIEGRRLRAEPDVLPLLHCSWSWRSLGRWSASGRSTRRSVISCPDAHRATATAVSAAIDPRTLETISASEKSTPAWRALSMHVSHRHEKAVAEGEIQTVVMQARS